LLVRYFLINGFSIRYFLSNDFSIRYFLINDFSSAKFTQRRNDNYELRTVCLNAPER